MNPDIQQAQFSSGDILAFYGTSWFSKTIRAVTASLFGPLKLGPSHVGIVIYHHGIPLVIESVTSQGVRCAISGRYIYGVQARIPKRRIEETVKSGGRVELYRLAPIDKLRLGESSLLDRLVVENLIGKPVPYDIPGAIVSVLSSLKLVRLGLVADLSAVFCSEVVAKLYMRLGKLNLANPTTFTPAKLCRRLLRTGVIYLEQEFK